GDTPMTVRTSVAATFCTLLVAACGPSSDSSGTAGSSPSAGSGAAPVQAAGRAGTGSATRPAARVDAARLTAADDEPGQWMSTGRTYGEQRYSPLAQITPDNVADLGLAWYADLGINRTQESTPLYVDGVLYVTTAWSNVQA